MFKKYVHLFHAGMFFLALAALSAVVWYVEGRWYHVPADQVGIFINNEGTAFASASDDFGFKKAATMLQTVPQSYKTENEVIACSRDLQVLRLSCELEYELVAAEAHNLYELYGNAGFGAAMDQEAKNVIKRIVKETDVKSASIETIENQITEQLRYLGGKFFDNVAFRIVEYADYQQEFYTNMREAFWDDGNQPASWPKGMFSR